MSHFSSKKPVLLALLLTTVGTGLASLQAPPESARMFRLENGLEVLTLHLPGAPMTGMNVQVKVGSALEDFSTSGMSHMLEHLLFNGSSDLSQKELYAATDRIGGYNNANTTRFYTNYMMLVPQVSLEEGMYLQNQMLFHSSLPDEKFLKEKGIVLEELAQGKDRPDYQVEALWQDFLFEGSSFELPTLGTPATVRGLDRQTVYDFYKGWYQPNNMLLSVVGGFDPDEIVGQIEAQYGQAIPGPLPTANLEGLQWEPGVTRSRRAKVEQPTLRMAWPAPDQTSPLAESASLLAWAAGDPHTGQIPALLFGAGLPPLPDLHFAWSGDRGAGRFELQVPLPMGLDPEEAVQKIQSALQALEGFEFSKETLDQRVLEERSSWALLSEKPHYFGMMQADAFVQKGFEEVLHTPQRLAEVRPSSLNEVAASSFASEAMSLLLYPDAPMTSIAAATAQEAITYRDAGTGQAAIIIDEGSASEIFALQVIVRGRSIWEGEEKAGGIDLIHRLMEEGAAGQDAGTIATRLKAIGAQLTLHDKSWIPYDDHYTSTSHSFLRIEVLAEFWEEACSLAADMMLHPTLPQGKFEQVRSRRIQSLGREELNARKISRKLLDESLYATHPGRFLPGGTEESLGNLTRDDLVDLHALAFRPENMILSIVSKIPAETILSVVDSYFTLNPMTAADLTTKLASNPLRESFHPEETPFQAPRIPLQVSKAQRIVDPSYDGAQTAIRFGSIFEVRDEDKAPLALLFSILSDKMAFDLREERGWAYSIGCWASPAGKGLVESGAYMGVSAENHDEALEAMQGYLDGVKGITQDDLDTIRGGITGRRLMRRLASINQAWNRALGELAGHRGLSQERDAAYQAVGIDDILRVQKTYLKKIDWTIIQVQ
jgi:zinc protease